jgi:hypothetical protein
MLTFKARALHGFAGAGVLLMLTLGSSSHAAETPRAPATESAHPGNIYLADEDVVIHSEAGVRWRALNERGAEVAAGKLEAGAAALGRPGIGWYRVEFVGEDGANVGWTTVAVLARLAGPVQEDSPVCVDAALSWLSEDAAERAHMARLARLAGVSWIRDRIHWREVQTGPDTFVPDTKYDSTATAEAREELKVLQVFHTLPKWVVEDAPDKDPRCPDLRQVYAFCKAMSSRFSGKVLAWEPWNEGNIGSFGGFTTDQLCSFQKAAYLGFKAGNPSVTVGSNPLGGINTAALVNGILANETWPYYDTYNIHSYDWPHSYEALWAPAREAACGKPIWVTECDRGIQAEKDSPTGDLSPENDLRKAELIAQEYASSMYAGANRHFHFILGHYMEGQVQFGLLRRDLTPRPGYVALAAVGRFLAGATCLGRYTVADKPNAYVIAFRGRPDGVERDVLVAWAEEQVDWPERGRAKAAWSLPEGVRVESAHDFLGRAIADTPKELSSAPVFLVLPTGEADKLTLTKPQPSAPRAGAASPVVLQVQMPAAEILKHKEDWTEEHDYRVAANAETAVRIYVYNFGNDTAKGTIGGADLPQGWTLEPASTEVEVKPMERVQVDFRLHSGAGASNDWLRVKGSLGSESCTVAFRVLTNGS